MKKILLMLGFREIVLFLKKTFGLTDMLTFVRHAVVSLYSWILSPMLFRHFNEFIAWAIMFIVSTIIIGIFLNISIGKTEKSALLSFATWIFWKNKILVTIALFILEPFLFIIYYRDNYYQYSEKLSKKLLFYFLLIAGSFIASIMWAIIIYFSGLRI